MKKLLFQWNKIKATFWFIPVVTILVAVLLSIVLVKIDGFVDISQDSFGRFFLVNSTDSARSILTTISGAMIGVAGTVFSVTLVALTLASSQFGPRLIKNFMYVRLNQVVLGSYVSTYLYCLLVLNALKDSEGYTFIPSISILAAIIGAIFNIVLLIVFIHQIATSIQADNVISDISDVICEKIEALSPGVNDPFTAITCIDNLTAALTALAKLKFPSKYRYDEEGKLRIIANTVDFEGALDAAFNQIRQFSGGSPSVIIRLMEGLITIHGFTTNTKDRDSVIEHAEMVLRKGGRNLYRKEILK